MGPRGPFSLSITFTFCFLCGGGPSFTTMLARAESMLIRGVYLLGGDLPVWVSVRERFEVFDSSLG